MKAWIEARKDETAAKVAEWKSKHEMKLLERRAERAERYAVAMADAAFAAIDEAEWAAIDAWLARKEWSVWGNEIDAENPAAIADASG